MIGVLSVVFAHLALVLVQSFHQVVILLLVEGHL
jgi:hypothetical protein